MGAGKAMLDGAEYPGPVDAAGDSVDVEGAGVDVAGAGVDGGVDVATGAVAASTCVDVVAARLGAEELPGEAFDPA